MVIMSEFCSIKKKAKILLLVSLLLNISNCVFSEDVYIIIHIQHCVAIMH